jgi:hypothetical protein
MEASSLEVLGCQHNIQQMQRLDMIRDLLHDYHEFFLQFLSLRQEKVQYQ